MVSNPPQGEEKFEYYKTLIGLIAESWEHHDGLITAVSYLEEINSSFYSDRRRNLLIWNRETRAFIRQLRATIRGENEYTTRLDKQILALEVCRMKLWSPSSTINDVADLDEIQQLQNAHTSPPMARQICSQLLANNGRSVFAHTCAEVMICALDAGVFDRWAERCAVLEKHMGTLSYLRGLGLLDWSSIILGWEDLAKQTRAVTMEKNSKI